MEQHKSFKIVKEERTNDFYDKATVVVTERAMTFSFSARRY